MGRLTNEPFTPSCCDGGFGSNANSAQPCGCDPGCIGIDGGYLCERHWYEQHSAHASATTSDSFPSGVKNVVPNVVKDATWRKQRPLWSGVLNYFPDALLEVAHVSWVGNEQHNPGQELHWDRSKSQDEKDACARHLVESGKFDTDGTRHSAKAAWRALANLQKELENDHTGPA
jgi:hypothetical protein